MKLLSFKRRVSFKGHGHAPASPTFSKRTSRITRLSPRTWLAGRSSSCKLVSEVVLELPPCASLRSSHPPTSPDVLENANHSPSRFSTQINDTCSNFAEEGSIPGALAPPVETPLSPAIVARCNAPTIQDDDIEEASMMLFDEPGFRLQYEQQRHAIQIEVLEEEYKEKLRVVVDEKSKLKKELEDAKYVKEAFEQHKAFWCERFVIVTRDQENKINEIKKELEAAREARDAFEHQKAFWNDRFVSGTRVRDDKIDELKRERNRFEATCTAIELRAKALEALANHQQVQLEEMRKVIEESELQLEKQREEYETSNLAYFQHCHDFGQRTEQSLSQCEQLEQEVEKLKATKAELEASLLAANHTIEMSTLKHMAREQEFSEDLCLAETRKKIAERHFTYLEDNWRAEHTKFANVLADCRAELRQKDKHIDVVRQQKDCCQHVIMEVATILTNRAEDGNEFARQFSLYVSEALDRNEQLGLQIFNSHSKGLDDTESEDSRYLI
ncbi:hypothetical protein GX51_06827 [Blastomyces parvus]|uniref:Uncharacterized protein n=1 Tax=Blastomyces parvus TaxID=2060905 RepID=A0A2B7WP56_9EURO|nr:hypothetical protein GX51_06827 [Blastomyces parvus]